MAAGDITINDVVKEIDTWLSQNKEFLSRYFYTDQVQVNALCTDITAIKGKYPSHHSIMTNVLQGFSSDWTAMGEIQIKHKILTSYRQKINYSFKPHDVLNTYYAFLHQENMSFEEMPISRYIMEELGQKIIDDLDYLAVKGDTAGGTAVGNYGFSLDGVETQVRNAAANTVDPVFTIPLNAVTEANILDEIKTFEKGIPARFRRKMSSIVMSDANALRFADAYEQTYGTKVTYTEDGRMKTPLTKMDIIPLDSLSDDIIFSVMPGVLARLIDIYDVPTINEVQKLDYAVKLFGEGELGYDFLINQLVFVADFSGTKDRGLNDAAQNALYYNQENL